MAFDSCVSKLSKYLQFCKINYIEYFWETAQALCPSNAAQLLLQPSQGTLMLLHQKPTSA